MFWSLNIGILNLPFDWLRVVSLSNHNLVLEICDFIFMDKDKIRGGIGKAVRTTGKMLVTGHSLLVAFST
jgi:hypothetical protein